MKSLGIFCVILLASSSLFPSDGEPQDKTFFVINNTNKYMTLSVTIGKAKLLNNMLLTPGGSALLPCNDNNTLQLEGNLSKTLENIIEGSSFDTTLNLDLKDKGIILSSMKGFSRQSATFPTGERLATAVPLFLIRSKIAESETLQDLGYTSH